MKTLKPLAFWFLFWFVLLFIISLPYPYHFLPEPGAYVSPISTRLVTWVNHSLLNIEKTADPVFISDSRDLYTLTFLLLALAVPLSIICFLGDRSRKHYLTIRYWSYVSGCYYLALQLFKYGFDKLFKHQFFLPEPNILYTPLGQLSRDILYWSTIGSSYSYSVFAGLLEIIPAFLLLFNRTRLIGALIALLVLINVLMINIGFDISVKLYASFLILLTLLTISCNASQLYDFFLLNKKTQVLLWRPVINSKRKLLFYSTAKSVVVALILLESLFIYFKIGNFNDDEAARPLLHGAYDIHLMKQNKEIVPSFLTNEEQWKRIFIHRKGYFITQSITDKMTDYKLLYDFKQPRFILQNYNDSLLILDYIYNQEDSSLTLFGLIDTDTVEIVAKKVDLKKLPLLRQNTQWAIDVQ